MATKRPTFSVGFLARCDNAAKIRESNRRTLGMRWRNGIGILDGRCNIVFEKGRRGFSTYEEASKHREFGLRSLDLNSLHKVTLNVSLSKRRFQKLSVYFL